MSSGQEMQLWELSRADGRLRCVARPGCHGLELIVRRGDVELVRERYPDRATLGERAWMLRREFEGNAEV